MDLIDNSFNPGASDCLDSEQALASGDAAACMAGRPTTGSGHLGSLPRRSGVEIMTIAAVLPTYNRAHMLGKALDSALAATVPAGCEVCIAVVDNNSTDRTADLVADYVRRYGEKRVRYVFEAQQGRQFALNRGIASSSSDIVAMFDDDETLEPTWFEVIAECFQDGRT